MTVFVIIKNGGSVSSTDIKYLYNLLNLKSKVNFCMGEFYAEVNNLLPLIKKDDKVIVITFEDDVIIFEDDDINDIKDFMSSHAIYEKSYDALEAYMIFRKEGKRGD